MPPDRLFIQRTLEEVEKAVQFLRSKAGLSRAEFLTSQEALYSSAYALLMAIEGLITVSSHLISAGSLGTPRGTLENFQLLQTHGILADSELAARLRSMARFRNLLVHRYWELDYGRLHQILQNDLEDFQLFALEVDSYLNKLSPSTD